MPRDRTVRMFTSLAEADVADADVYAAMSPQERVDLLLELIARYREAVGEAAERFERVHQFVDLDGFPIESIS